MQNPAKLPDLLLNDQLFMSDSNHRHIPGKNILNLQICITCRTNCRAMHHFYWRTLNIAKSVTNTLLTRCSGAAQLTYYDFWEKTSKIGIVTAVDRHILKRLGHWAIYKFHPVLPLKDPPRIPQS